MTVALNFTQIVTLALQMAQIPGFTSQGGQMINAILEELAQTYDFDTNQQFYTFNFSPTQIGTAGAAETQLLIPGSGPYVLPTNFLRAEFGDVFWTLNGVPYPMIALDAAEFDMTVQQSGVQTYPYWYFVDMSPLASGAGPNMYVYPPASGAYPCYVRYRAQPANTTTPETSTGLPWFPSSTYLYTRLAGELMRLSGDERWIEMLGEGPHGAQGILKRLLPMMDNPETKSKNVKMDRRRFGPRFMALQNTKTVGW